jgi:hypothetical protein
MDLLKKMTEFFSGLYLQAITKQEPARPNPEVTLSAIREAIDPKEAPLEVIAQPPVAEVTKLTNLPEQVLWCPFAVKRKEAMTTRGKYRKGYPEGAIVHFTSGSSAESSFQHGLRSGYCFFVIHEDGTIWQSFPLDSWGYHAGESFHPKLGNGVSRYLVGIEISNAGVLTKKPDGTFETWFGRLIPSSQVRHIPKKMENMQPGYYARYTENQEQSLRKLVQWLKMNHPTVFDYSLVLGHDEVAPQRKSDPGGALSVTMVDFRDSLKKSV